MVAKSVHDCRSCCHSIRTRALCVYLCPTKDTRHVHIWIQADHADLRRGLFDSVSDHAVLQRGLFDSGLNQITLVAGPHGRTLNQITHVAGQHGRPESKYARVWYPWSDTSKRTKHEFESSDSSSGNRGPILQPILLPKCYQNSIRHPNWTRFSLNRLFRLCY